MKLHWHDHNPWKDQVVYVPIEELAEALTVPGETILDRYGQTQPYNAQYHLQRWQHTSVLYATPGQLDAYILPQPSGWHSCGVRWGPEGSQYFSPHNGDHAKVQALLNKYAVKA